MLISIIVPLYNEETNISILHEKVSNVFLNLSHQFEIIFINDGSTDQSLNVLKSLSERDEHVKYISFSNNFGKESAMYCGLEYCNGDAVIIMDSDLQHPPEKQEKKKKGKWMKLKNRLNTGQQKQKKS